MRFLYQLGVIVAMGVFLLGAVARADVVPAALIGVNASTGFCAGFNCDMSYSKALFADKPATLRVECAPDDASICAQSKLLAGPSPTLSAAATTSLGHTDQDAGADINVSYYYEILCDGCAPGTIVPLLMVGGLEAHYFQGTGGTVEFTDLARVLVSGYNPLNPSNDFDVASAFEGLQADPSAPDEFGFCESSVVTGSSFCAATPKNSFLLPFEAPVNRPEPIFLGATAFVHATNQPFDTSSAEATVDPVISFAPGFDSTGFSIALSPGIGNEASTVPEPATWMLLSTAALAWLSGHRLRRRTRGSF
jgi:hypothetical protein